MAIFYGHCTRVLFSVPYLHRWGRSNGPTGLGGSDARGYDEFPSGVDNGLVVLEYEGQGAMAVIETASMETDPGPHRRVEVHGLEGSIVLEPIESPKIDHPFVLLRGWLLVARVLS